MGKLLRGKIVEQETVLIPFMNRAWENLSGGKPWEYGFGLNPVYEPGVGKHKKLTVSWRMSCLNPVYEPGVGKLILS